MASLVDTLLDSFGLERKKPTPTREVGSGGTAIQGGYIVSEDRNAKLSDNQRHQTYRNLMVNTSIVAAGTRYFLNLVAKADWKCEPADDSAEAEQLAEWMEEVLQDMNTPWNRIIRRQALYKFYGFAVQEWTAKKGDDGRYWLKDIESRPQKTIKRWDVDPNGNVIGMAQEHPITMQEIYLPRGKVFYTVDDTFSDSPEGLGVLRQLVEPASRLERYLQLEGIGYENDLSGMPIVRAPLREWRNLVKKGEMEESHFTQAKQVLTDFLNRHAKHPSRGMIIDSEVYRAADESANPSPVRKTEIDILRGEEGSLHQMMGAAIERLNREMARIMGVEFLLLGGDGSGSLALSRDKTASFYLLVDSALTELAQCAEWDIMWPLWEMNGLNPELMPKLKPEAIQFRDVEQITQALKDMAVAGAPLDPRDPACDEVRDLLGLTKTPQEIVEEMMAGNDPDSLLPQDPGSGRMTSTGMSGEVPDPEDDEEEQPAGDEEVPDPEDDEEDK